jgi:RimJ/RimL family protein N-acetyltransferase
MQVHELKPDLLPKLREYLERNAAPNVYFLFSLFERSERSKFYVTLDDGGEVTGALMVLQGFRRPFAWLAGDSREAASSLAKLIQFSKGMVWTSPEFEAVLEDSAEGKPWKIVSKVPFSIMTLERSRVKLDNEREWRKLSPDDSYAWAKSNVMMNFEEEAEEEHPEKAVRIEEILQKEPTKEDIASATEFLKRSACFGIFDGDTLAARSAIEYLGNAVALRRIFTHPNYRKKGYGLAITSVAVEEALKVQGARTVLLFVRASNESAKRLYEKIGFRPVATRTEFELSAKEVA